MARTARWFPVAQDINGDPEVWILTDTFGDRSLRIWLEILSITDRLENRWRMVDGWLASLSRKVRQSSATVSRVVGWLLAKRWLIVHELSADGSPLVVGTRNYERFHRLRNTERAPDGTFVGAVPNPPNPPNPPIRSDPKETKAKKAASPDGFAEFYSLYPRKKNRGDAEKAWRKLNPDAQLLAAILNGLRRARASQDWQKQNGQFIPYPGTWLRAKGWLDEGITFATRKKANGQLPLAEIKPTTEQVQKSREFLNETINKLTGKMGVK